MTSEMVERVAAKIWEISIAMGSGVTVEESRILARAAIEEMQTPIQTDIGEAIDRVVEQAQEYGIQSQIGWAADYVEGCRKRMNQSIADLRNAIMARNITKDK